MIRCIHKGWGQYSLQPGYKLEENRVVLSVSTSPSVSNVTFGGAIELLTPDGAVGETAKSIRWNPAIGNFSSYRIYYKKVGDPDADGTSLDTDQITDEYMDGDGSADPVILAGVYEPINDTSLSIFKIDGLSPYSYYQFKVVACFPLGPDETEGSTCDKEHRVMSDYKQGRMVPKLVPFAGIKYIGNPTGFYACSYDEDKICGSVFLHFDAIPLALGTLSNFKVFCGANIDFDFDVEEFPLNGDKINSSSSVCHNLSMTSIVGEKFIDLTVIEVKDIEIQTDSKAKNRFFFKMFPYLNYDFNTTEVYYTESPSAVVMSIYPEVRVPSGYEFSGLTGCTVDIVNKTVSVAWDTPLGGNYEGFEIFYRKENLVESFSYGSALLSKATAVKLTLDTAGEPIIPLVPIVNDIGQQYQFTVDQLPKTARSYQLSDGDTLDKFFEWGESYQVGVSMLRGLGEG